MLNIKSDDDKRVRDDKSKIDRRTDRRTDGFTKYLHFDDRHSLQNTGDNFANSKLPYFSVARQFVDNIQKSRQTNVKSSFNEKEGEMIKTSNSWTRLKSKIDVIKNMRKPDHPIETGKIPDEVCINLRILNIYIFLVF